ncbi:MAG: maleylpyruvate isomerase family mycothiol-dependent enzyme [Actinomycetota bacterium]|nr:maleylpyruvate isomerase family mycothiol-dependent enzyme [Actinomycetota bacterium]
MDDRLNAAGVRARLDDVAAAEARLRRTVESFAERDLAARSLCEGWTRGHVLAHVALNAHSLVNLMQWARTGIETPQYPGWEERDRDIDRLSTRTGEEHLEALTEAADAFAAAAGAVPPERWAFEVRGIGGPPQPAHRFLFGRLREVEIHHVDLRGGYGPHDWDPAFVRTVLAEVPERLGPGAEPAFTAEADDAGITLRVGEGPPPVHVRGPGHALLAWLLGRSDGADLDTGGGTLPRVPAWG